MNRFKLSFLLLIVWTNCFIVWASEETDIFVNRWIEDIEDSVSATFCAHDGFLNGTCQCGADYRGSNCQERRCRNFGVDGLSFLKTDRCLCPPGFFGRNCEPVRCVEGRKAIFRQSEKTIALLATTNVMMEQFWNDNSPKDLVCSYTNYTRIFSLGGKTVKVNPDDACAFKYTPDPCDPECSELELSSVYDLVSKLPPNTLVFVLSNQPLDLTDVTYSQQIIATAIAKRIQINVILYANDDSSNDILSEITRSTLGSFVKSSLNSDSIGLPQYQTIDNLLKNFDNDVRVSAIGSNTTLPFRVSSDIYISGQVDYGQTLSISKSNNQAIDIIVDTDYWKLYRINASSIAWITVTGQTTGTNVLIYTQDRLTAYSAFTNSEGWADAMYPTAIAGTSYPLILRVEDGEKVLEYDDIRALKTFSTGTTFEVFTNYASRVDCQFNLRLESSCNSSDVLFLYILSNSWKPVILPVLCIDTNYGQQMYSPTTNSLIKEPFMQQSFVKDTSCTAEPAVNKFGSHSFVIISPNSIDENSTKSAVDNLYRNPNSLFYQLYKYVENTKPNQYSNFIGSVYDSKSLNLTVETSYEYFLTSIMSVANQAQKHDNEKVDIVSNILSTVQSSKLNPFSDIFLIIDSPIKNDTDQAEMLASIQSKRVRLYIIYVSTYTCLADDDYKFLNNIAIQSSGGLLAVVNDYNSVSTFFENYWNNLVDTDMVVNGYSAVQRAGIALNDVNLIESSEYFLLVTNRNPTDLSNGYVNVTVSIGSLSFKPISIIGDVQQFKISVNTTGSYNIAIRGFSQLTNVVLLESMAVDQHIGLTFVNNQNVFTNKVGYTLGAFQPLIYSSFDFTVASSKILITQVTDSDSFALIYNGSIVEQTSCDSAPDFKYSTNFKWVCSQANGLYRAKIDLVSTNGTYSRTFPLTCVSSTTSKCLNDGSQNGDTCACSLGWSGSVCEIPVCLNGGIKTSGNTCQCVNGFSGSHCESSSTTCQNLPDTPDFRSDLSSLMIVAESNALQTVYLDSGVTLPGIPITVVKYSNTSADIVLTTTDGSLLNTVLNQDTGNKTNNSAQSFSDALNYALNYQNYERSLIVVITSQNDLSIDPNTLIRLAAHRTEMRILTTANITDSLTTLSLIGNSIPIPIQSADDLKNFFTTYVAGVFNRLNSRKVFNVYQTDVINVENNVNVVIPVDKTDDSTDNSIILHVVNGGTSDEPKFSNGLYKLYIFDNIGTSDPITLTLIPSSANTTLYYSIERVNYLNTAYGFSLSTNGSDEQLVIGARINQTNTLSIYTSPLPSTLPSSDPLKLPYLEIREILNGRLDDPQTILLTRKPDTCRYTHFVSMDICANTSVLGYQIRLNTRTSQFDTKQQQFTLTCHNSHYLNDTTTTTCGGDGSPQLDGTCLCDKGYRGIDCREPICENGVRDGSICRCPIPYFGKRCEKKPESSPSVVVFILDLIGVNDFAFNETINTVKEYLGDSKQEIYTMIIVNDASIFKPFNTDPNELNVFVDSLYKQRNSTLTANLNQTLAIVANNFTSIQNIELGSKYIFYLTQIGLSSDDNVASSLSLLSDFQTSAVVYYPYNVNGNSTISNTFAPFTTNTKNVNNYYDATTYLISQTTSQDFYKPTDPARSCAYGLQANVIVAFDASKTDANTTDKEAEILTLLRNKFNFVRSDIDRCSNSLAEPEFYNGRSLFSAFIIYDDQFSMGRWCPSNYDSAINSLYGATDTSPEFNQNQLMRLTYFINNNAKCSCSRTTNSDTTQFLIWLPRAYSESTDEKLTDMVYKVENSAQFVIPFYEMNSTSNDLYYNVLKQNKLGTKLPEDYIIPNAINSTPEEIIDALELKMCKLAKVPGYDV